MNNTKRNNSGYANSNCMKNVKTPKQLKECFPYQFGGPHIGLEIALGWFPKFAQLCADIDHVLGRDTRIFHWRQLKEKFGSARWYWHLAGEGDLHIDIQSDDGVLALVRPVHDEDPENDRLRTQIRDLVTTAVDATRGLCIVCGERGIVDSFQGYHLVLCDDHARQRAAGKMTSPWFSEDQS